MARGNIAVFHAGALGDFVLTWFIPLALRQLFPGHQITYVTHSGQGRLAERFLGTTFGSIDLAGWHTLHSPTPSLQLPAREMLDCTDIAVCFIAEPGSIFTTQLRALSPGLSLTCVAPLPPQGFEGHITAFYLQQLAQAFPAEPFERAIHTLATAGLPVDPPASQRILLHPGAGSSRKCWPLASYLDLADGLRTRGSEVTILLGEAEMERLPDRLIAEMQSRYDVRQPRDLVELAEELLNARLLIANDNGPGHLAAVLGRDVLSLFGPTDPMLWRPLGPRARILRADNLATLPPSQVLSQALLSA